MIGAEGGESEVGDGSTVMAGWVGWRDTDFNHSVWRAAFLVVGRRVVKEFGSNWLFRPMDKR
ncbi:hypothetical protein D3C87_2158610 [compost metagenome]